MCENWPIFSTREFLVLEEMKLLLKTKHLALVYNYMKNCNSLNSVWAFSECTPGPVAAGRGNTKSTEGCR